MWWAILTRREEAFKKALKKKLKADLAALENKKQQEKTDIYNTAIKKLNKLSIEYKYEKATKSMIHDWEKSQANSMLAALRYIWILA